MSKWHLEILDDHRKAVWQELRSLPKGGMLAGGTALALQIGHRRSYDFDVFYGRDIQKGWLVRLKELFGSNLLRPLVDNPPDELTLLVEPDIKLTLLRYPFPPLYKSVAIGAFPLYDIRDLASSKAYTIGRRGAWRDYVDMYFLLRDHVKISSVIREAQKRFEGAFSEKLFIQQLQYFDDIEDFSIEFVGKTIKKETIQNTLAKWALAHARARL